jgi:hypothetical protein
LWLVPSSTTLHEDIEGENTIPVEDIESESSNLNTVKWDKSSREVDGYKCQSVSDGQISRKRLYRSIRLRQDNGTEGRYGFGNVDYTVASCHYYAPFDRARRNPRQTEPLMRPCLPGTASYKKEENNWRPGKDSAESNDKRAKGDAESSATSTQPLIQDALVLASQDGKAARIETVSHEHNETMQQYHRRASLSDHEYTMEQFLGDNEGVQTHNVSQDDQRSPNKKSRQRY